MTITYCWRNRKKLETQFWVVKQEYDSTLENNFSSKNWFGIIIKQNGATICRNCFAHLWAKVRLRHLQWKDPSNHISNSTRIQKSNLERTCKRSGHQTRNVSGEKCSCDNSRQEIFPAGRHPSKHGQLDSSSDKVTETAQRICGDHRRTGLKQMKWN